MAKKPALGSGERFKELAAKVGKEPGVKDPDAVAAAIGDKKYGKKKMGEMAHGEGPAEKFHRMTKKKGKKC